MTKLAPDYFKILVTGKQYMKANVISVSIFP